MIVDNPDREHEEAMAETGFWGRSGSGCIVYAKSTGRFLIGLRSEGVMEPLTWGTWGGAVPKGMSPEDSALLELYEETGFDDEDIVLVHAYKFKDEHSGFIYDNYIAVVEDEFVPELNWENIDFGWFDVGKFPNPMHNGLKVLLDNVPDLISILELDVPRP